MSRNNKLKKEPSLYFEKEDFSVPEDEIGCLSQKLYFLEKARLEEYRTKHPESEGMEINTLDFNMLIKKTPFEDDFRNTKTTTSKDENKASIQTLTKNLTIQQRQGTIQLLQRKQSQLTRANSFQVFSADNSFDNSLNESKQGLDTATHSKEIGEMENLRKGILKKGAKSRFSRDLEKDGIKIEKLVKSKKSSSFRLPSSDSQKQNKTTRTTSAFRKKTVVKR